MRFALLDIAASKMLPFAGVPSALTLTSVVELVCVSRRNSSASPPGNGCSTRSGELDVKSTYRPVGLDRQHQRSARRSARQRDRDRGQRVRGAIPQVHLLVVPCIRVGRRQEPRDRGRQRRTRTRRIYRRYWLRLCQRCRSTDPATALAVHADVRRAVRHAGQINRIGRGDAALGVGQVVGGTVGTRRNRGRIKHDLLTTTRERPRLASTRGAGEGERPVGAGTVEIDTVDGHRTSTSIRPSHRLRDGCGGGAEIHRPGRTQPPRPGTTTSVTSRHTPSTNFFTGTPLNGAGWAKRAARVIIETRAPKRIPPTGERSAHLLARGSLDGLVGSLRETRWQNGAGDRDQPWSRS